MKTELPENVKRALKEGFIAKHGRNPGPDDPVFDKDVLEKFRADFPIMLKEAARAGILPKSKLKYVLKEIKKAKSMDEFFDVVRSFLGV